MTTPSELLPHHAQALTDSVIAEDVSAARGYRSVETLAELKRLGFGEAARLAPTLLIPVWSCLTGEVALYHHRPDQPRLREGKVAKYEIPPRCSVAVDVHPLIRDKVRDPSVPLFITEGVKKADAAISRDLCCLALIGVWNWRGGNEWGGKTALPDWDAIALKGKHGPRQVYLVFDSDVMLKAPVHLALARLSAFLEARGGAVAFVYLPHGENGRKIGLDDFMAAGHTTDDLLALASRTLRPLPPAEEESRPPEYRETSAGLIWRKPTRDGFIETPLANFTARIAATITEDDGAEARRFFEVNARLGGRSVTVTLSAAAFPVMNWPIEHLGAGAIVYPGMGTKDHTRAAIQILSSGHVERHIFAHTGWREVSPGAWAYLHAGGAVGAEGVDVRLSPALEHYRLPAPPDGPDLVMAVRASLGLLDLLPDAVAYPLLGATYRAGLGSADFSISIAGPSGVFKSELAALAQQHYGAAMDARHLPAAWSSTDNFLEGLAFTAKDALLGIDDFAPTGSAMDVQRLHGKADRVLRGQGNGAARGRMNADGTLRAVKPPRGLILSTGEDVPQGLSLRGRMCILEVAPGDVAPARLSACQHDAAAGLYAQAMAGYLAWLAPRYGEVRDGLREEICKLRAEAAQSSLHRRTPEITANLALGLRHLLRFAVHCGAVDRAEVKTLWERGWRALGAAAQAQGRHQAASEPTLRFLELLSAAVASGKAHVAGVDGDAPTDGQRWGWRPVEVGTGEFRETRWQSKGDLVGWVDGDDLYLQPDVAYNMARRMGGESGDGITLGAKTLNKRLKEKGLLVSTDEGRGHLTVRQRLSGLRRSVLRLHTESLGGEESAQSAQSAPSEAMNSSLRWGEGDGGPVSWADSGARSPESAQIIDPTARVSHLSSNGHGPIGPIGPIFQGGYGPESGSGDASPGLVVEVEI